MKHAILEIRNRLGAAMNTRSAALEHLAKVKADCVKREADIAELTEVIDQLERALTLLQKA